MKNEQDMIKWLNNLKSDIGQPQHSQLWHYVEILDVIAKYLENTQRTGWIPVSEPPKDGRNVFLAHGTNNFKSCCIGHYDHSMGIWYEDKNFFAKPIYDCKYWCDIPELPDMGDSQFNKGGDTE